MIAARGKVYAYSLAIKHFIFNVVAYTFCGCRANLFAIYIIILTSDIFLSDIIKFQG